MYYTAIKKLILDNQAFWFLYSFLLLAGFYPLFAWDKISLLLTINAQYHPILDQLFFYITNLGHGLAYLAMMILLFICQLPYRKMLIGSVSFIGMSIIVQIIKRIIFPELLRPIALVPDPSQLHLVDQVEILRDLTFPSGHAATIFTAVCFIHLIMPSKKPLYTFLLITLAIGVAYSRIYLCQHFYRDVYVGMLIGGLTTLLTHAYFIHWQVPGWLAARLPIKI